MIKPKTWEEWAELNSTNRAAYAAYKAADPISQEATSPDDWCFRHLYDCPICKLTMIESIRMHDINGGFYCPNCGMGGTAQVWNKDTGEFEPLEHAWIRAWKGQK